MAKILVPLALNIDKKFVGWVERSETHQAFENAGFFHFDKPYDKDQMAQKQRHNYFSVARVFSRSKVNPVACAICSSVSVPKDNR